ncbi:hypothetical protein CDEST_02633 [Colletotrichum destructivum]|uniref:Uncharacterized protein n=1 Tax=Colletotrichum destructivum TaxID=34406 RepID=A0AAX4I3M7_9PEZI|nr:hypothetical protein CDEST_02633 [Colletotrichum destructivum]
MVTLGRGPPSRKQTLTQLEPAWSDNPCTEWKDRAVGGIFAWFNKTYGIEECPNAANIRRIDAPEESGQRSQQSIPPSSRVSPAHAVGPAVLSANGPMHHHHHHHPSVIDPTLRMRFV